MRQLAAGGDEEDEVDLYDSDSSGVAAHVEGPVDGSDELPNVADFLATRGYNASGKDSVGYIDVEPERETGGTTPSMADDDRVPRNTVDRLIELADSPLATRFVVGGRRRTTCRRGGAVT